jgi:hypothetical protein
MLVQQELESLLLSSRMIPTQPPTHPQKALLVCCLPKKWQQQQQMGSKGRDAVITTWDDV